MTLTKDEKYTKVWIAGTLMGAIMLACAATVQTDTRDIEARVTARRWRRWCGLLEKNPTKKKQELFSINRNIKQGAPPTFILHANDDTKVPVENSLMLYKALRTHKIPVDMHLFSSGGHGFNNGISKNRWLPQRHWILMNERIV